jgi:NAD(P)-dependent dehydrogenase (short-subunit alcohol dehydrogenase family)
MMESKVVLVTGAGRGIGRYIAHTFAGAGAKLAVNDLEPPENVAEEIQDLGADALAIAGDVRNEDDVRALMEKVVARYGRIDVLVNNAGIVPHFNWGVQRWPRIRDMEQSFWQRVMGTNLGGTFTCTKHVLPYMEKQGAGHIVNLHGGGSGPGAAPYVVSKDAIVVFTRMVAEEERESNICIVVMTPGSGQGIAHEEAPDEAKARMPGLDTIGDRFVLAAQAPMELSGKLLAVEDGRLVVSTRGR